MKKDHLHEDSSDLDYEKTMELTKEDMELLKKEFNNSETSSSSDVVEELIETYELDEESEEYWDEEDLKALDDEVSSNTQVFREPILTDSVLEEHLTNEDITVDYQNEQEKSTKESNYVKGAAWLTAGEIFSRILGALYVIPWATWLGQEYVQANSLFSIGYKPYTLFLAVATAGFPSAIAKQMAKYHSKREYKTAHKLFRHSSTIMLVTGLVSASILFFLAPILAAGSATDNPEAATFVIRSLVPALFILPLMSLLRGYFQGLNNMQPTAVSQIIEQVARVFYMLTATYAIMKVYSGDVTQAVVHSTFAAFVGAACSLAYLAFLYIKQRKKMHLLIERSDEEETLIFTQSLQMMLVDSVPFVLLGSGIIIAQIIDLYSFRQILEFTSLLTRKEISILYGALSLDVDKLIMIVISLAVALASSSIPAITSLFAVEDYRGTQQLIQHIVKVFSFIMFPAAIGMATIAHDVYYFFYPSGSAVGPSLLVSASALSIVLGAYTIFSTMLQSMNFRKYAITYLMLGLITKLLLQFPMIAFFHAHGAIWSTMIGFLVAGIFMWVRIQKEVAIDYADVIPSLTKIITVAVLMGVATTFWNQILSQILPGETRMMLLLRIVITVLMGALVYGLGMALTGQLSLILGDKYKETLDKIRVI